MATLSADELVQLVRGGGGPWSQSRERTVTAVAVALAESGGRTAARNTNRNGSTDTGLWQINSVHKWSGDLTDPRENLRAAESVWSRQGWGAWYAYPLKSSAFLPAASAAYSRGGGGGSAPGGDNSAHCPKPGTTSNEPPPKNPAKPGTKNPKVDIFYGETHGHGKGMYYKTPQGCNYKWDAKTKTRTWADSSGPAGPAEQYDELLPGTPIQDIGEGIDAVGDVLRTVGEVLKFLANPDNWIRIIYVVGGTAAVIAGLVVVAKNQGKG